MSLTTWIQATFVQPVIDAILSPANIEKITQAVVGGVLAGIGSEIAAVSAQVVGQADRVITTTTSNVAGSISSMSNALAGDINSVSASMTGGINSIIAGVIQGIKNLLPFHF